MSFSERWGRISPKRGFFSLRIFILFLLWVMFEIKDGVWKNFPVYFSETL